jgi:hypothetical protein
MNMSSCLATTYITWSPVQKWAKPYQPHGPDHVQGSCHWQYACPKPSWLLPSSITKNTDRLVDEVKRLLFVYSTWGEWIARMPKYCSRIWLQAPFHIVQSLELTRRWLLIIPRRNRWLGLAPVAYVFGEPQATSINVHRMSLRMASAELTLSGTLVGGNAINRRVFAFWTWGLTRTLFV